MVPAPTPYDDARRVSELRAHRVLDTPPDPVFDDLTALAAEVCGTPMAAVSLIDHDRQWFKARYGMDTAETGRAESFCGHVVFHRRTMVVEDALQDERFTDNPLVTAGDRVRFYAGAPLFSASGQPLGALCVIDHKPRRFTAAMRRKLEMLSRQVSKQLELHRMLAEAKLAATTDVLTGLLNRCGMLARVDRALTQLHAGRFESLVLAFVDLDRFKPINDSYGQDAGDAVLRATADRLTGAVNALRSGRDLAEACVARMNSDEFVVTLAGRFERGWAERELPRMLIDAVSLSTPWRDKTLPITCSCGLAFPDGEHATADQLLCDSDIAMYHAKRAGGRRSRAFLPPMRDSMVRQLEIESDLRQAIDHGDIHAVFQPIINLRDNVPVGVETLARWTHAERGSVPPPLFIECAERSGLIGELFDRVIHDAVHAFHLLRQQPNAPEWISLNLSRVQLVNDDLCDRLIRTIEQAHIDLSRVHLEITESLVGDDDAIIRQLQRLREKGLVLMLDDFGVGASTLSCLHRFPIEWIKVDHHFMRNAFERRDLAAVLCALAQLAGNLDLKLVAEGVEQSEQVPMLQAMDIGYAQGYYFSKPQSAAEIARWCRGWNAGESHQAA